MIGDPDTMLESCQNDRGPRHDARELSKRYEIRTQYQRAAEMIGNPDTMSESC